MLRCASRWLLGLGVAALALGGATRPARADFQINIFADAGLTTQLVSIVDNGAGDSNPLIGQITVSGGDLGQLNTDVSATGVVFSALEGTSNASSPDVLATLTVGGKVAGNGSLFVVATSTDYSFPAGPSYGMDSTSSNTFTGINSGAVNFTSYFNSSNALNGTEQGSPTLSFPGLAGTGSASDSVLNTPVSGAPLFSLTNVTGLTVNAPNGTSANLGFLGGTTVRAIPEPGSIALLVLGGSSLFVARYRRRRAA